MKYLKLVKAIDGRTAMSNVVTVNPLVFALVFMLVISLSFAGISVTNYTVSKTSFQPGEPGVATVTISNPTGSYRVTGLTMTIDSPYELTVLGGSQLSDIEAGGSAVVSVPIKIKSDARAGVYLLRLEFLGFSNEGGSTSTTVTNSVSIPVTVLNSPRLSFDVDKTVLTGIDTVALSVNNNGGAAKNVRIATSGTIGLYGTNEIFVGGLDTQKNITMQLDSRNAVNGPNDLSLVVKYEDELGTSHSDTYTLRMTVKKQALDVVFLQNSELVTRKESEVALAIRNTGTVELNDVRLSFTNATLRLKDRNELAFGDIAPGATAEIRPTIFADLSPGLNLISATLSWVEKDVTKEETVEFPLTVSSDADVGVYLEAKPSPLQAGQEHTISVLVSNLGSYSIDNVDVHFSSDSMKSLDISSGQYIGSLNHDDFSTVQFKVRVENVPEGEYPINIRVSYRDRSGEWKAKDVVQKVNIYNTPVRADGTIYLVGGIVAVALVVWYFFLRKKKPAVSN